MAASEAAVTAVMDVLGCDRVTRTNERHPAPWTGCAEHFQTWTHRGCPVAVAAADAAVDADRASIQAETLREAAEAIGSDDGIGRFIGMDPLPAAVRAEKRAQEWLRDRADRIEGVETDGS